MPVCRLERSVISLRGDDVAEFLNGLITNSLQDDLTFAALLTPQGKVIADFFIHKAGDHFLLETAEKFAKVLALRLKMYKLRAKIDIVDVSADYDIYALWDGTGNIGLNDPRHPKLGQRLLAKPGSLSPEHTPEDYDLHRMSLGVPDSMWDFDTEQMFPADANMDLLNGVDYKKGCFIGQEVVSRMHRKTDVRKRMRAVKLSGTAQAGDGVKAGGRTIGKLNHVRGDMGMALIRLDRLAASTDDVLVNDIPVTIMEPNYEPQS
ncbi:MAG: folate-binding protein YgfZ [Robiginitomaculum sp.]|nr:folate-binding protein YgfZ [Robiginitomaculum sp.]